MTELPEYDGDAEKREWFQCPNCESRIVVITVGYDRDVKFECADCGEETERDYGQQWSRADIKQYRGE